jgi:hypothetical protein
MKTTKTTAKKVSAKKAIAVKKAYNVRRDVETPSEACVRTFGVNARTLAARMGVDTATVYALINDGELFAIAA